MQHLLAVIEKGGFFVWPILAVSVAGLAIILERYFTLYLRLRIDRDGFLHAVLGSIDGRQYQRALGLCAERPHHPLTRVLKAGLLKANRADKEIERAMEEEILRVSPALHKRIDYLSMFANVATLLGLLGTLFGLSTAFEGIGMADAVTRAGLLAKGVSETMLVTALGLLVAIPATVFFHVLQNRANAWLEFIQESAVAVLNHLSAINRDLAADQNNPRRLSKLG